MTTEGIDPVMQILSIDPVPRRYYDDLLEQRDDARAERDRLRKALERLEPLLAQASAGKPDDYVAEWLLIVREALNSVRAPEGPA